MQLHHPKQLCPFPERLSCRFQVMRSVRLRRYCLSGTDQFTAWVKTDPHATLVRHVVDAQKASADFSEAYRFNKNMSNRSPVQKRLSIYNWNPGPRRGKEDAFEKQICAILFNKDTFYPNIDVKSIYLHYTRRDLPDQVMEGEQGWVMQGVLSGASFRRPPISGLRCCLYI